MSLLSIQSLLEIGKAFTFDTCNPLVSSQTPTTSTASTQLFVRPNNPDDEGCKLLDSFAIIVQLTLVSTALITLFYKRSRETPQRPVIVWALDVSKQFAGAGIIHFLNLFISYIAGRPRNGGPKTNLCVWYFLNVAVDTTIGVAILWGWLRLTQTVLTKLNVKDIKTGQYGSPPIYKMLVPWLKQTAIFVLAESLMKLCVFTMFRHLPFLFALGEWALRWTKGNYRYQVLFVMLIFPLIMNIIQFWIVDTIVKVGPNNTPLVAVKNIQPEDPEDVTINDSQSNSFIANEQSPLLPK